MEKNLFTIGQVAESCGISRSTIRRLENRGLLTPCFCDKENGYRYYDNFNITKILQIKMFLEIGLQYDDILEYFNSCGMSSTIADRFVERISILKRGLEEMRLRIDDKNHMTSEIINLPEFVCYAREYIGTNIGDRYDDMYNLFHEAIEKGYRPLATEPLFVINKRDDFLNGKYGDFEVNYICCVPVEPDCASEETVTIPACRALSVLYYGHYNNFSEAYIYLGEKIKELGLNPIDYPRTLGLVAPYTGREIKPDKYVTRLALPIDD